MRTKVVNPPELSEAVEGILYVLRAVTYRVEALTSVSVSSFSARWPINYINPNLRQLFSAET